MTQTNTKTKRSLTRGCDPGQRVYELQRDLRRLGYLASGLDGSFGPATETAVRALQIDLLENDGGGPDRAAPVSVASYNRSRVTAVNGVAGEELAACMAEMLADEAFCKIPSSQCPEKQNARVRAELQRLTDGVVPLPFLTAILEQESGCRHFHEPKNGDGDSFVIVGLDRGVPGSPKITSRGYGIGQITLFHHPPTKLENDVLLDNPCGNANGAMEMLRCKFDKYVNGATAGTRADDRLAEIGDGPLRRCRYPAYDLRHMDRCRECVAAAGVAPETGIPNRAAVGCDWPYAARRYNGSGPRSYQYQAKILLRVLNS